MADVAKSSQGVEQDMLTSGIEITEKKKIVKKKKSEGETKAKKTKKSKKSDAEKENISVKSSFSKFDQLSKKTVLHVRSTDASKAQKQFNQATPTTEQPSHCKACEKQVFQMEQIKAEKAVWHKNCFRCKECNKQLTVDTYSSNDGELYCKPHFKDLFKPKAVVEEETGPVRFRKPEMIIRESQPIELPPDVVRSSDKPDYGLEELTTLNVKSRFQVFEKTEDSGDVERSPSCVSVKRSPSILSKLARFQAKGMDVGVTDDSLNGIPYEESSSSSEEEEDLDSDVDVEVVRASRKKRERPVSFSKMGDIKSRWETGHTTRREEQREERKVEIQNLRSRLFMGKQGKMKEMYEQAVIDSERSSQKKDIDVPSERAKSIKEKFERGEPLNSDEEEERNEVQKKAKEEELSVFEAGISKKSRSLFLELDATASKTQPLVTTPKSPAPREDTRKALFTSQQSEDIVRSSDQQEDVQVQTADLCSKFKFFETYKAPEKQRRQFRITPPRDGQVKEESPEREIYRDPEVVRSEDKVSEEVKTNTAKRMLSIFRQMEEKASKDELPEGPKPLKRFTPPPDYTRESESESEEEEEEEEVEEEEEDNSQQEPGIVRAADKIEDEFLKQAFGENSARAKNLRAKFEKWESTVEKENKLNLIGQEEFGSSIDTTRNLRARFESMKEDQQLPRDKSRPKVNRFV